MMHILTWNIRGILSSKSRLRRILNKSRPSVVALLEPFLGANKCSRWARWLKLPNFFNNAEVGGKIWIFWADGLDFEVIAVSDQAISGWFVHGNCRVLATFVYASCFRIKRLELCEFLCGQNANGFLWFVGGILILFRMTRKMLEVFCSHQG